MRKPICLITGATEGIGKATAVQLALTGFTVVLAVRNVAKAQELKAEIVTAGGQVDILEVDLSSLRSVRQLADTFNAHYSHLDVLINNAGVFVPARTLTEDGFEWTFQINYLAGFFLTQLLLGALERSPQGRIINLTSSVYTIGKFDEANLQSEKRYSVFGAYAASKLLVLLSSLELAGRLKESPITVNAVHPGIIKTQMMLRAPGAFRILSWLALPFAKSPREGARTSVHLAASPQVRSLTGRYFVASKPANIKSKYNTMPIRRRLWDLSMASLRNRGVLPESSAAQTLGATG